MKGIINRDNENLINQERVKELFEYDPETGNLIRKVARQGIRIGISTGSKEKQGYIRIAIDGKLYQAHRLIWLYHYGKWPEKLIDHINRNKSDNRIENLREVSPQENTRHQKIHSNNSSGHCGVHWNKPSGKWCAQIKVNKKILHLGYFINQESAIQARKEAELKYNFSPFHGNTEPLPSVVNL